MRVTHKLNSFLLKNETGLCHTYVTSCAQTEWSLYPLGTDTSEICHSFSRTFFLSKPLKRRERLITYFKRRNEFVFISRTWRIRGQCGIKSRLPSCTFFQFISRFWCSLKKKKKTLSKLINSILFDRPTNQPLQSLNPCYRPINVQTSFSEVRYRLKKCFYTRMIYICKLT